jgi:hypothetical protein
LENIIIFDSQDTPVPIELIEYKYREKFKLSNVQMEREPMDKFRLNLKIMEFEAQRDELEAARMERKAKQKS